MVKPVSLSDPAFAALRREKRMGESDSDVVLRLIDEASRSRRDPLRFRRYKPRRVLTPDEHVRALARMDTADRTDPWK